MECMSSKKRRAFKDETLSSVVRDVISAQVRKHCVQVASCEHEGISSKTHNYDTRASLVPLIPSPQLSSSHQQNLWLNLVKRNDNVGDFPGSPVVKTPCFHCRGHGFNPWSRN